MYVQTFVKGIADDSNGGISWVEAKAMLQQQRGIHSNWWRSVGTITSTQVAQVLTDTNLDLHLHAYGTYGHKSPFISLAAGCIERDTLLNQNYRYSAVDTALEFATGAYGHAGVLFFGWIIVGPNPAVKLSAVAESVRELNVYHRWSPYQLEGEITAKIHIPANQIERAEWWGPGPSASPVHVYTNPHYESPTPILNLREYF